MRASGVRDPAHGLSSACAILSSPETGARCSWWDSASLSGREKPFEHGILDVPPISEPQRQPALGFAFVSSCSTANLDMHSETLAAREL